VLCLIAVPVPLVKNPFAVQFNNNNNNNNNNNKIVLRGKQAGIEFTN
jgi:hypothetical protein